MLPKKSPLGTPSNWRLITIGSHILRAYCKVLACRLTESAITSVSQKAFRSVDECGENLALVAKASDSVSHTSLRRALRRLDAPNHVLDIVKDLYIDAGTSICVSGMESEPTPITRGVKQGCPLSPFLFCAVVDEYLESLGPAEGYRLDELTSVAVTGFADDLVIVSETKLGMQRSLDRLDRFLCARGLAAHPAKCASLGLERAARGRYGVKLRVVTEECFTMQNPATGLAEHLPRIAPDEYVKYLGLLVGPSGLERPGSRVDGEKAKLQTIFAKIGSSSLKPLQKIKLLKHHVVPRLQYRFVKGSCSMNLLRALDRIIRNQARRWLHLPRTFNTAALQLPTRDGGVGVASLLETVSQMKMGLLQRLQTSGDPAVRFIAAGGLWGREIEAMMRHFQVGFVDRAISRQLKKALIEKKREEWSTSWHGKGAENFFGSQASNKILRDDLGPGRIAIDLLRLRSQSISCRVSRAIGRIPNEDLVRLTCRRCGEGQEDTMHLLQTCPAAQNHRVVRHDRVLVKLKQWLQGQGYYVLKEPHVRSGHTFVKPDLLLQKDGQYSVLDLCVPFECDLNTLRRAEQQKIDKYRAYDCDIRGFIRNNNLRPVEGAINYLGVAIGARGGIRPATRKLLSRMGVRGPGIETLLAMAIEGSINILRFLKLQAEG